MTTYRLEGIAIQYGETNGIPGATAIAPSSLTFTVTGGTLFDYTIRFDDPDFLPLVGLELGGLHRVQIQSDFDSDWTRLDSGSGFGLRYEIGTIHWGFGRATQVMRIDGYGDNRSHLFALGGTPLPPLTTVSQLAAFDLQITHAGPADPATGLGPGQAIDVRTLPGIARSEDDHFAFFADFATPFDAGPGDDLIEIFGGQSHVSGGDGADTVRFFDFNLYEVTASVIEGGVHLVGRWYDHVIRDDVERIEFRSGESYGYDEFVLRIPGDPQLLEGGGADDSLEGGTGHDTLIGFEGDDHLSGGRGDDRLDGGAGEDLLEGGEGQDTIITGAGADLVRGEAGSDVIHAVATGTHGPGFLAWNVDAPWQVGTNVRISIEGLLRIEAVFDGGDETDTVILSDGSEAFFLHDSFSGFHAGLTRAADSFGIPGTARLIGIERIEARGGDDVIDLTSPDYSLAGQELVVLGGDGNDVIWGSDADEWLFGEAGDDTLFAGSGRDYMTGGTGADRFEFTRSAVDVRVQDFTAAEGDSLVFHNRGGAVFEAQSVRMTGLGFEIDFADTASGLTETLTIRLAAYDYMMNDTLEDVTGALVIV